MLIVTIFLLSVGLCFAQEKNEESNFTGEAKLDLVNNYYWRGVYLYPEGVPALQPSLTVGFNKPAISLNIWSSLPLRKRAELKDLRDELDLTLNYDLIDRDNFGVSVGFVSYIFFVGEFWHSEELYISVWHDIWNGFGIYAQAFFDVDAYKGIYFNFGPSYNKQLTKKLNWDSKILLSFVKYSGTGFSFIETGLASSLAYQINQIFSLGGGLLWNYNAEDKSNQYVVNLALAAGW